MDAAGLRTESTLADDPRRHQRRQPATLNAQPDRRPNRSADDEAPRDERGPAARRSAQRPRRSSPTRPAASSSPTPTICATASARSTRTCGNYYVLTYVPKNTDFDGKFREIDVKVKRSGVRVASRKGYFAVTRAAGAPVLGYEAPALAALDRTPAAERVPGAGAAAAFPERRSARTGAGAGRRCRRAASRSCRADDKKTYTSDFIVLVQFKDDPGQVIEKVSQRYQPERADRTARTDAKMGEVLFYREPVLTPGVYTIETVVYDTLPTRPRSASRRRAALGRRAKRAPHEQPGRGPPRASSVPDGRAAPSRSALRRRAAALSQSWASRSARRRPRSCRSTSSPIPRAGGAPVRRRLSCCTTARSWPRRRWSCRRPMPTGRVAQVSRIPIEALAAGTYELRSP